MGLGHRRRVSLFLSDVETDPWSEDWLGLVVAAAERVLITRGSQGATEYNATGVHPVGIVHVGGVAVGFCSGRGQAGLCGWLLLPCCWGVDCSSALLVCYYRDVCERRVLVPLAPFPRAAQVDKVHDTNGAGDTFATGYMLALARGLRDPALHASWAASRAVMQPQSCKPQCAAMQIEGHVPAWGHADRLGGALRGLGRMAQGAAEFVLTEGIAALWHLGAASRPLVERVGGKGAAGVGGAATAPAPAR